MASTYTLNNGIELIGTGEQSGTWGDTTNTNLELIDTALDGQISLTLSSAGSSGSPNSLPVSDGASSNGRNRLIFYVDGGDLGATAFVQLTPNDAEKIIYIRNALSGSRSIIVFQGTYNASNDYEIPAGKTAVIYFNGGGTGAVAANVFNNAHFDALNIVGAVAVGTTLTVGTSLNIASSTTVNGVLDEDNMASNSATKLSTQQSIKAYVDSQVGTVDTLAEVLANGNTTGGTDIAVSANDDITFADSSKAIFGAGSDLQIYHNGTNSIIADVGAGNIEILGNNLRLKNADASNSYLNGDNGGGVTLYYAGNQKFITTATGIQVTGNIANTSGDLTLDVAGTINLDSDNGDVSFKDGGSTIAIAKMDSSNFTIQTNNNDKDIIFKGYDSDGGGLITALTLDMSDAGAATFNGNVGIGCVPSSIQSNFDTLQIGGNLTLNVDSTGANAGVYMGNNVYRDSTNSRWEYIYTDEASQYYQANGNHVWRTASSGSANAAISWSERMRIDPSGNLLVGKSAAGFANVGTELAQSGFAFFTRNGGAPVQVNRLGVADGALTEFHKNGSAVGSIGVNNGDNLTVQGKSDHSGIEFGTNAIYPHKNSANVDNTIDLGEGGLRFKDIYLSGSIANTSGDLTLDVAGDIILDAAGADIGLNNSGSEYGKFNLSGNSLNIHSSISNGDIIFKGNSGGSAVTALTLDMSDAGHAKFNSSVSLVDNAKLNIGTGADLQIYHDGSNSIILDQGVGNLQIRATNFNLLNADGNENYMSADDDGAVTLYHDNTARIATSSSGVTVTGTVAATSYTGDGSNLTGVGGSTTAGAVGTYALMWRTSRTSATSGSTVAGSGLRFASTWADSSSVGYHSTAPSGTWRLMGSIGYYGTGSASSTLAFSGNYYAYQTSLYVRIS